MFHGVLFHANDTNIVSYNIIVSSAKNYLLTMILSHLGYNLLLISQTNFKMLMPLVSAFCITVRIDSDLSSVKNLPNRYKVLGK